MKLSRLLIGGFLIVASMCGVIGFVTIGAFNKVGKVNAELQELFVPNTILMIEMEKKAYKVYSKGMEYIIIHREYKEKAAETKAEMIESMGELKELGDKHFEYARYLGMKKRKNAQQILDKIVTFNYALNGIINFIDYNVKHAQRVNKKIAEIESKMVNTLHSTLVDHLTEHKMEHMQELKDVNITVIEAHISAKHLLIIITFVIIVFAIIIGLAISRSVTRPINELKENTRKLGKGNLDTRIKIKSKNEIGELAVSFNHMADDLKLFSEAEKKRSEELQNLANELMESEEKLTQAVQGNPIPTFIIDNNHIITHWNNACESLTGFSSAEMVGTKKHWLAFYPAERPVMADFIVGGATEEEIGGYYEGKQPKSILIEGAYEGENFYPALGEKGKWLFFTAAPLRDYGGNIIGAIQTFQDITERKQSEEKIKASLKEKEVLLSEIHHRVKNNMQVIISLLRLQANKIEDKKYADMFKEGEDRIRSMSLIHEQLYQTPDLANINFREYIKTLSKELFRSHVVYPNKIKLNVEIEDIAFDLENAIPCGLIINELLSNSLKYAFPDKRKGKIEISLLATNEDELELTVSDDGIGISKDMDIEQADTMGLHLVKMLAEHQLSGKITLNRTHGTQFNIKFKRATYKMGI